MVSTLEAPSQLTVVDPAFEKLPRSGRSALMMTGPKTFGASGRPKYAAKSPVASTGSRNLMRRRPSSVHTRTAASWGSFFTQ